MGGGSPASDWVAVMYGVAVLSSPSVSEAALCAAMEEFRPLLDEGRDVAFVVRKGALTWDGKVVYRNDWKMLREEIIRHITAFSGDDPIVSTTGKASRELFELRTAAGLDHGRDFLTVGSMGHSSSIALGVALNRPERRVWCIDGDGAALTRPWAACRPSQARPIWSPPQKPSATRSPSAYRPLPSWTQPSTRPAQGMS